ncbi:RNA 2',3'-cyclic phosphodiesterase [Thalassotalea maritima]|uniref:RNA 2',3'-cyclic phosphodiesterase n=1 Tax=Thalassotalea maritima TaxID=3242416 RepID=UPI003528FD29
MTLPLKRVFFALNPSIKSKKQIHNWLRYYVDEPYKPVPMANFHITLQFLGQITEQQQRQIEIAVAHIESPKLEVRLDTFNYWPKPKILWLGCRQPEALLLSLQQQISQACHALSFVEQHSDYTPHLTLSRKAYGLPELTKEGKKSLDFVLTFNEFCLMQSVSTEHGVRYDVLRCWPLR